MAVHGIAPGPHDLTRSSPLTRELWLLFHRDVGRSPQVRAVIDRITAIATGAKAAFLGDQAAST